MKKSLVVILTLVLVFSLSALAGAAAPVDVPANHWAYDAVKKLAADGLIDGFDNGRFNGDKTLTRYEFAVIVAKAIGKEDKVNVEQKALIEKLAAEYKAELTGLGIRVKALENRSNAIQISGAARARYDQQADGSRFDDTHMNVDVKITYKINDDWAVKTESEWQRQFDQPSTYLSAGRNANNIPTTLASYNGINGQTEQLYVTGPAVGACFKIGKHDYRPVYGLGFDTRVMGVEATWGNDVKTTLSVGKTDDDYRLNGVDVVWAVNKITNVQAGYQKIDNSGAITYYSSVGFDTKIAENFFVTAAAAKSDVDSKNNKAYLAALQYKVADTGAPGSHDFFISYKKIPSDAVYSAADYDREDRILDVDFKGTRIGFDYVPMKNTKFTAWYMVGKDATTNTTDIKVYRSQLEFYF